MGYVQVVGVALLTAVVSAGHLGGSGDFGPSTSYGAPASGFGQSGVSSSYGAPSTGGFAPSSSYGAPGGGFGATGGGGFGGGHGGHSGHGGHGGNEQPKAYQFGYAVRDFASGNDYHRHETSDGNVVQGEYRVKLPDGRTQIVSYTADWQNGYRARVTYEGEATYPQPGGGYNNGGGYNGGGGYNNGGGGYNGGGFHQGGGSQDSYAHHGSSQVGGVAPSYGPPGYNQ